MTFNRRSSTVLVLPLALVVLLVTVAGCGDEH
jgi:hypothetical protein